MTNCCQDNNNLPHNIVKFRWKNEMKRFQEWPKCLLPENENQEGGGVEEITQEYYEEAYKNYTKDYENEHFNPYIKRKTQIFKINILKSTKEL